MVNNKNDWELVVGLEVHAQLNTRSKLFSYSSTEESKIGNDQVSLIDAAMPGTLPIINKKCVELCVKAGIALDATINKFSMFDRKNYFYPDSPQGYQISQFFYPIVSKGKLDIIKKNGQPKRININRIHIEQDAGKSIHNYSANETFIDLNRMGIPLIEIVTDPDFSSTEEVEEFIRELRNILRYTNVCDGNLEKGSIRCDANISVKKHNSKKLGTRVEIKNLNSFKAIRKSIMYEMDRHIKLLEEGQIVLQETRLFNSNVGETKLMRKKEELSDYRYFPDPDLLPLKISSNFIDDIRKTLPELPKEKEQRYITEYSLSKYDAKLLTSEKDIASFFEEVTKVIDPKLSANWICVELLGRMNKISVGFNDLMISTKDFTTLLNLIYLKKISGKIAKYVLDKMFETNEGPEEIVKKHSLTQISDKNTIMGYINKVLSLNPEKVQEIQNGKSKILDFFIGQVMKIGKGRVNPDVVNKLLREVVYYKREN